MVVWVVHFLNGPPKGAFFSFPHKGTQCANNRPDLPTLILSGDKYYKQKFHDLRYRVLTYCIHIRILRGSLEEYLGSEQDRTMCRL